MVSNFNLTSDTCDLADPQPPEEAVPERIDVAHLDVGRFEATLDDGLDRLHRRARRPLHLRGRLVTEPVGYDLRADLQFDTLLTGVVSSDGQAMDGSMAVTVTCSGSDCYLVADAGLESSASRTSPSTSSRPERTRRPGRPHLPPRTRPEKTSPEAWIELR